jgi:site-specific DNA-methyltransferase (adenine-specific)
MGGEICEGCGARIDAAQREERGQGWLMQLGDCLELIRRLPDGSVDGVITDPPYGSGGFTVREIMMSSKNKYSRYDALYKKTMPDIDGDSIHPEEWMDMMKTIATETRRVLDKERGVFAFFIDWRKLGLLHRIIHDSRITVRGCVIWDKVNGRPYRGGFRSQVEFIVWGSIGKMPRSDLYLPGVLRHTTIANGKVHFLQKPTALMSDIVRIVSPGGLILDPFAGSSTTGVAAIANGYRYHGMESVPEYYETSTQRLRDAAG